MLEGIIIFGIGFLFGKYTNKIIDICKGLYLRYFDKEKIDA